MGRPARAYLRWLRAAWLRLALGPDRPREHHVPCFHDRRLGAADAIAVRHRAARVRIRLGDLLRRVRRDLLAVPGNLGRYVRLEVRNHEQRHALHGKGYGGASGAARHSAVAELRLDHRVLRVHLH